MYNDYKITIYNAKSEVIREETLNNVIMNIMNNTIFFNDKEDNTLLLIATNQFGVIVEKV
ncbi:MAG: hypothetical protein V3G42_08120 [Oscillospiraceae bacterium]